MRRLARRILSRDERGGGVALAEGDTRRERTDVDRCWSRHTVNSKPFKSARESAAYLEWRFDEYPLYREFMDLWGEHDRQTILDFGCGPGNDVTGFLLYTGASKVIGVDVSPKALDLARRRLHLHDVDPTRFELILSSDASPEVPLPSESVDYFQSSGVLHHTSDPEALLKGLHRVLAPAETLASWSTTTTASGCTCTRPS